MRDVSDHGAVQHRTVRADDGAVIAYRVSPGDEPAVVMLHGLAGSGRELAPSTAALPERRVVVIDQRGHGASTTRPLDLSRLAFVDDAAAVIRAAASGPVDLVGQSMGAHTAMLVAAAHPDLVRRLVLVEGDAGSGTAAEHAALRDFFASWPVPFADLDAARSFLGDSALARAWLADLRTGADGLRPRFDPDVMHDAIRAVSEPRWDEWESVVAPVLVVYGEHGMFSESRRREFVARGRNAHRVDLPGAGHDPHLDAFDAWIGALRGFLIDASPDGPQPVDEPQPVAVLSPGDVTSPVEVPLAGGNAFGLVVRVGDTVRKPWTLATARVIDFLAALSRRGLDVPEQRGRDERGRQIIEYVPGVLAMHREPLSPAELHRVGGLVRDIHDAAAHHPIPDDAGDVLLPAPSVDLFCHNDLAPWNLVTGERWVFIDWDGAGPSSRIWDLAYAAQTFALNDPAQPPVDAAARLAAFVDGYRAEPDLRRALPDVVGDRAQAMRDLLRDASARGREPWATMHRDGHGRHWQDVTAYVRRHADVWAAHLIRSA